MQNNVISRVRKEQCCGCGACFNKCPANAISMLENSDGFLVSVIDESKCTHCGLCLKACPGLKATFENNPQPDCYAAIAEDEIRMKTCKTQILKMEKLGLERKISELLNLKNETNLNISLIANKNTIFKKYYRYKILSKLLFGKKREHYKWNAAMYYENVRKVRNLQKEALNV